MSDEVVKIPHRPQRFVGRWAFSLGHELFKIEEAYTSLGLAHYIGTGLQGQKVHTSTASVLRTADEQWIEERTCES